MARGSGSEKNKRGGKAARSTGETPTVGMRRVSDAAVRGAAAIGLLALSGFLIIAGFHGGGTVGIYTFEALSWLLGVGYLLFPISLVILAALIIRSYQHHFGWIQITSIAVFLFSSLGLIEIAFPGEGGIIGSGISHALIASVDMTASVIFLIAFIIASLVIALDADIAELFAAIQDRMRMPTFGDDVDDAQRMRTQKLEDVPVTGMPVEPEDRETRTEETPDDAHDVSAPAPQPEKKPAVKSFADRPDDAAVGGFPIIATGSNYEAPPVSLLAKNKGKPEVGDVKANMNIIKRTLQNFGIQVEMDEASIGPTVTRYAMKPAEGVRLAKIVALQSNLELALAASPVRIEAPIPGKSLVGIEVPNIARTTLGLAPLMTDPDFAKSEKPLMIALGRSINGQPQYADLAKMPHMLVAGTTGAGKSVTIHDFIVSLLYRCGPEKLRFIMVDPKRVELTLYNGIPHLLTPVITDPKKAILSLKWLAKEMERRYNILETERVRDIASYHENVVKPALERGVKDGATPPEAMPYIVFIIDELADLMQSYPRELEAGIVRLAQMSRAVGIHLILSTQRPSVKVITGLIKANIPARVALQVASQIDSRTILDMGGAEKLLGAGDMLFLSGEMSKPRRIQATYISESEVKKVVAHIIEHSSGELSNEIDFTDTGKVGSGMDAIFSSMGSDDEDEGDELYGQAKQTVIEAGKASTSYLQRKLGVGYARAAKLIDLLEERGVVGPADGAKPRDVIGDGNADDLVRQAEAADDGDSA